MRVGILGAGAMGSGIAQVAAKAGEQVLVYDSSKDAIDRASAHLQSSLSKLQEKGKLDKSVVKQILANIQFVSDPRSFIDRELIIEAVVEDLAVKHQVFQSLESMVSDTCILATNTSSLSIASIAAPCKNPGRVIGIHFFNPATLMPLVEVVPGIQTVPNLVDLCVEIMRKWEKVPVVAKDLPGFIVNRLARCYYGESIRIYEEGIASFATIDWALKEIGGFKMGPFELMDFIGNDVNFKVTESVWEQFFYEPRFKPSLTQKRLYEAKLFGKKSGRGYYDYSDGAIQPQPAKDLQLAAQIFDRVIAMLINEAVDALYLKLASRDDLDMAMVQGVNYPKGLLKWADEIGIEKVLIQLENLVKLYGEERYRPCLMLKFMAAQKKKFY